MFRKKGEGGGGASVRLFLSEIQKVVASDGKAHFVSAQKKGFKSGDWGTEKREQSLSQRRGSEGSNIERAADEYPCSFTSLQEKDKEGNRGDLKQHPAGIGPRKRRKPAS